MTAKTIRLGLIGDNIAASQSPRLHEIAGRLCGLDVTYERLVPPQRNQTFEEVFAFCGAEGFTGINVTYPYKERVVSMLDVADPAIRQIAACNTVLFGTGTPQGFNTDFTGFVLGFRTAFGHDAVPGRVAMIGAGGVGKAVAFGLVELGCRHLTLFDRDQARAEGLAVAVRQAAPDLVVEVASSAEDAVEGADGLINCTPLGMVGYAGSAVPASGLTRARWAFDAVYTPVDTEFLLAAKAAGLSIMSGYELFFFQGVDAFRLFTGQDVDQAALRLALKQGEGVSV
ncbi:shikimate dehydrogenase family protein [Affinirhizobium pseudoryzae]|uniref:shikimate dehydrogenase family protein n=1 Tax=Allorhizobium pseudoryzae TaxID=379684 RepID=UPI0013EB43DE|nr:shikimate dehydrogenase [Allorhizobium pseudoryzae]